MERTWAVIGCGYTGERLTRVVLDRGARVIATLRSAPAAQALADRLGCEGRVADTSQLATLRGWIPPGAVVVVCAPPGQPPGAGEAEIATESGRVRAHRIIYISSTGVYPPGDGGWVDESTQPAPESEHGRRRLEAETQLLEAAKRAGIAAVSLRAAGIYGPGRGAHARMAAGNYQVLGDGATYVNRIHVDDLVGAIVCAAEAASLPSAVYNVADDEPVTSRAYADAVASMLNLPRPGEKPLSEASDMARAMLRANRRISNARLKRELGWKPNYPTFREGVAASV